MKSQPRGLLSYADLRAGRTAVAGSLHPFFAEGRVHDRGSRCAAIRRADQLCAGAVQQSHRTAARVMVRPMYLHGDEIQRPTDAAGLWRASRPK